MMSANLFGLLLFLHAPAMLNCQDPALCGTKWGCFRDPSTCTSFANCKALVMYQANTTSGHLELAVGGNGQGYVAFGLNSKLAMDGIVGEACLLDSGTMKLRAFTAVGQNRPNLVNLPTGYNVQSLTNVNGYILCRYSRPVAPPPSSNVRDAKQQWYLAVAHGTVSGGGFAYHGRPNRLLSSSKVDLLRTVSVTAGGKVDKKTLAHGGLMAFAWMFCAIVGIFSAGIMKKNWSDKEILGQKVWFIVHRVCMVSTVLLTVISFIIIFVAADGLSDGDARKHAIVGIVVTVLALIQPVMALFRPHPGEPKRWIFNVAHAGVGRVALTLATINIFWGLHLFNITFGVIIAHLVFYCIMFIIGGVVFYLYCKQENNSTGSEDNGRKFDSEQPKENSKHLTILHVLFWLVVVVTFALAVAQIALIANKA